MPSTKTERKRERSKRKRGTRSKLPTGSRRAAAAAAGLTPETRARLKRSRGKLTVEGNFIRERIRKPGAFRAGTFSTVVTDSHRLIRGVPKGATRERLATQAVLHPLSEFLALCDRGRCKIKTHRRRPPTARERVEVVRRIAKATGAPAAVIRRRLVPGALLDFIA